MTNTQGPTSPNDQLDIPDAARDAVLDNVPRGYRVDAYAGLDKAAPLIVAAELDRLIRDPANFTPGGEFRVIVLVKRITELRKAGV